MEAVRFGRVETSVDLREPVTLGAPAQTSWWPTGPTTVLCPLDPWSRLMTTLAPPPARVSREPIALDLQTLGKEAIAPVETSWWPTGPTTGNLWPLDPWSHLMTTLASRNPL